MNKKWKRTIAVACTIAMAVGMSGCGNNNGSSSTAMTESELEKLASSGYPIETDKTLTVWGYRGGASIGPYSNPDEYPCMVNYEKSIGVDLQWTFPASGQETQQFNLLLASGDLPDLIGWYWTTDMPGGAEKAIQDGYITALNDYIPKYAPGFQKYLEENAAADRELKTDAGNYYYFPSYVTDEASGSVSAGYMMRQDWLDEFGLEKPETIEEWETVLRAFQTKEGVEAPFTLESGALNRGFAGAFDIQLGWYTDGESQVKYGYVQPEYKQFLETMNRWYTEGLLDKNIATIDSKGVDAKMLNGKSGASFGWLGNNLGKWLKAGQELDPDYDLTAVRFPVLNKGDTPKFGTKDAMVYMAGYAVSASSKNKELAIKVLDYGFTEEGRTMLEFGIEGDTYTVENGEIQYNDAIQNGNGDLSAAEAKSYYVRNTENIPMYRSSTKPYLTPSGQSATYTKKNEYPQQDEALEIWGVNLAPKYNIPSLAPQDENYGKLSTDISAYAEEMMLKFITGEEPLSNFDSYLAEMNTRGYEQLHQIMQNAYTAYLNR